MKLFSFKHWSIRTKLVVIILLTSLLAIAGGLVTYLVFDNSAIREDMKKNALLNAKLVGEYSAAPLLFGYQDEAAGILSKLDAIPGIIDACIYDANTEGIFATYHKSPKNHLEFPEIQKETSYFTGDFLHVFHEIKYKDKYCGTIFLRISTEPVRHRLNDNLLVAGGLLVILLLIILLIASNVQKVISRPILNLAKMTRTISEVQDFSIRLNYKEKDEIGTLYDQYNYMLQQISQRQNERDKAEEELRNLNDQLENRVNERTAQLLAINKELESFSYSISHDLRAPLRAIFGFSQILARRHRESLDEEGRQYMDYIVTASIRMEQLINDLLNYSRLGRRIVELHPVPLNRIIDDINSDFKQKFEEIGATYTVSNDFPEISGDESLLMQVFTNLVENAVTYRRTDVPLEIKISCESSSDEHIIKISDNGIGIAQEYFEKIFNIFQRLHSEDKYPGTGIGLATVRKAVNMMNGRIWLESVIDKGTTFIINFPK